jgi:glutaredoxin 3
LIEAISILFFGQRSHSIDWNNKNMTSIEDLLNNQKKKKTEIKKANALTDDNKLKVNVDHLEIKKVVDDMIASNRVVVFSKSYCPYCRQAKMALQSIPDLAFAVVELDDGEHEGWQACISEIAKEKTVPETANNNTMSVPQIFINDRYIGGADDLADMFTDQRLSKMLGKPLS